MLYEVITENVGIITFSPLNKGILTNRYLNGIPEDSRIKTDGRFLKEDDVLGNTITKVKELNDIATSRGQTLAQMALAWNLRHKSVCSVLIGASKVSQIVDCAAAQNNLEFSSEELEKILSIIN